MNPRTRNHHAVALSLLLAAACGAPAAPGGAQPGPVTEMTASESRRPPGATELATFALG